MENILVCILTALYVLLFLSFTVGVLRASRPRPSGSQPSVSIVVPLHNEEAYVLRTLESLDAQDYPGEWEVICVNDRSTDKTPLLLEEFVSHHPRFRLCHIPLDAPLLPSPKKRALAQGFSMARYEILATMDADCTPTPTWLSSMASRFQGEIAIVQGAKRNNGGRSLLHSYQKLDTLGFTLIEAAGFSNGHPMVASAAALAYRKDLFYQVNGFSDLMQYPSGDDDMLVHKMVHQGVQFCYNMDPDAVVETEPVHTWMALLNQRSRWASNGTKYANPFYVFFLALIYCFYAWLFLGPFLALPGWIRWSLWGYSFLAKFAVDALFLIIGGFRLRLLPLVVWLPCVELIQVPLIAISVPMGSLFGKFRWR
ncbi:MAG TPA: glycosyltransferase [Fibrobacteraceae bacterium]|nr:glycosyltransferase [Fibrobacteraceae bacterium]